MFIKLSFTMYLYQLYLLRYSSYCLLPTVYYEKSHAFLRDLFLRGF